MQKLLTKAILKKLPPLFAQDQVDVDPTVFVKFFNPCGAATWYITEGEQDGDDFRMFGLADLFNDGGELGYISLNELASIRLPFGLRIERDIHFTPCPLSTVMRK
jgi:hypothetical protein